MGILRAVLLQMLQGTHTSSHTWASPSIQEVYTVKFTKVKKVKLLSQGQMWILNLNAPNFASKGCRNVDSIRFGGPVFLDLLVELTASSVYLLQMYSFSDY